MEVRKGGEGRRRKDGWQNSKKLGSRMMEGRMDGKKDDRKM